MPIIWHEAHVLLREDPKLFGRAADAIMGVAAEHEFCSDDVLLIQPLAYSWGACSLEMYAEDPMGQFSTWYSEDGGAGAVAGGNRARVAGRGAVEDRGGDGWGRRDGSGASGGVRGGLVELWSGEVRRGGKGRDLRR